MHYVESESAKSMIKNADSEEITFIIDLAVNADSNENLNLCERNHRKYNQY